MERTHIDHPYIKKGPFSSIYRGQINKTLVFIKIYNAQKKYLFNRLLSNKHLSTQKKISKLKFTPKIIYLDNLILIQKNSNLQKLTIKELHKKTLQKEILKMLLEFQSINSDGIPSLYDQIIDYNKNLKDSKIITKINQNKKILKKYLNKFSQNILCHGDLHFGNIIRTNKGIQFIDFDYMLRSSKGFDISMLIYQEKIKKNNLFKKYSQEINHYKPICLLLDFLWQEILVKSNFIKRNKISQKIILNSLENIFEN